ncbi:PD-(D/E)XK motif protein [Chloroflexota bacterium]
MRIETLWKELEDDQSLLKSGIIYKRFSGEIKSDIYVAVKSPEKLRCIAARVNASMHLNTDKLDNFREIKMEVVNDQQHPEKQFLLILLLDPQHQDIFATLSEDLMNQVKDITDENQLIKGLFSRLVKWQALFEKAKSLGLSEESQIGLYGELFFLRKFLTRENNQEFCVDVWKGPECAIQDFQHSNWAVEVKVTHGKNHQKIHISSERQLDTDFVPNIYLYHLSVDIREEKGENLNDLVDSVFEIIKENSNASALYKSKLLDAGFFDNHRSLYSSNSYNIRRERIFRVNNTFPRITESQIPSEIGDVRYSIVIGDDVPWKLSDDELFLTIRPKNA